ncbi:MarR family winged helix-turn-helix transcriptional regulator [Streptomonospora litoralis]|uniref:Organic hydroperoxide resistance transcriptional regulator n=1 Tax=Streptomonospora litoralis TaxID=2498135 RepID=A0A4P6Q0Z7_9ACTN|nr:MarR family transcriptional regulator [Streptomonospora litoralis]QBI54238.1 Organic hydroperoxide resistance transcriptional regulator [Streptomonospora litoralis]
MTDTSESDPLALERQLCFAVYAASRALTGLYRELLGPLGLTYPQYLVMLVLWEHGGLTVKELGARLQLDSGTLSPLLRRLEAGGLVQRSRTGGDERVLRVTLTGTGAELREQAAAIPARVLDATGVSAAQAAQLRTVLEHITDSAALAADELREQR